MNRIPLAVFILDDDEGISYLWNFICVKLKLVSVTPMTGPEEGLTRVRREGEDPKLPPQSFSKPVESCDFTNVGWWYVVILVTVLRSSELSLTWNGPEWTGPDLT